MRDLHSRLGSTVVVVTHDKNVSEAAAGTRLRRGGARTSAVGLDGARGRAGHRGGGRHEPQGPRQSLDSRRRHDGRQEPARLRPRERRGGGCRRPARVPGAAGLAHRLEGVRREKSARRWLRPVEGALAAIVGVVVDSFEVVWVPRFAPSRVPLVDARWTAVPLSAAAAPAVDTGAALPSGSEAGVRWRHVGAVLEYSLSFFRGCSRQSCSRLTTRVR